MMFPVLGFSSHLDGLRDFSDLHVQIDVGHATSF
jgi:hypothetical protein